MQMFPRSRRLAPGGLQDGPGHSEPRTRLRLGVQALAPPRHALPPGGQASFPTGRRRGGGPAPRRPAARPPRARLSAGRRRPASSIARGPGRRTPRSAGVELRHRRAARAGERAPRASPLSVRCPAAGVRVCAVADAPLRGPPGPLAACDGLRVEDPGKSCLILELPQPQMAGDPHA